MDFNMLKKSAANELTQYPRLAASSEPADQAKATAIRQAIGALPDRERDMLEQFFVNRKTRFDGHVARLCVKYKMDKGSVHRVKNEALLYYCVCMMAAKMAASKN